MADQYRIDLVIVNAGITSHLGQAGEAESWADIERVMTVNARAAMATVTALLPAMRRRGTGQIALISSLSAWYGLALTPVYCASKAALKAYGEALGGWLAPEGIGVTVVLPGFVASAMSDRFPGPRPFMMSADQAARRIRRGAGAGATPHQFPPAAGVRYVVPGGAARGLVPADPDAAGVCGPVITDTAAAYRTSKAPRWLR